MFNVGKNGLKVAQKNIFQTYIKNILTYETKNSQQGKMSTFNRYIQHAASWQR